MFYQEKEQLKMEIIQLVKQKEELNEKIMQNIKRIHELEADENQHKKEFT